MAALEEVNGKAIEMKEEEDWERKRTGRGRGLGEEEEPTRFFEDRVRIGENGKETGLSENLKSKSR
jgi:hypothetical protein